MEIDVPTLHQPENPHEEAHRRDPRGLVPAHRLQHHGRLRPRRGEDGRQHREVGPAPQVMDIREQLRRDHAKALAELTAVGAEADERRAQARLARLRHAWMLHALAEETVVYRALEGAGATAHADER